MRMVPYAVSREWIKDDAKDADAPIRNGGRNCEALAQAWSIFVK